MKNKEIVIQVNNLVAGYGSITILDQVTFQVSRGEIFIILGGSGCGKSTLLKHLIGLLPPVSGEILILGQNLSGADNESRNQILQQIGVAFQSGALFGSMTIFENLCLPLKTFTNLPDDAIENIIRIKLSLVGLEHAIHQMPSELSGGMKKRAALARAMVLDPAVIFLDEPSAGLDPITSAEMDQLIKTLAASLGITFVIVTHELVSVETIADRIILLEKKHRGIVAQGSYEQLKNQNSNPYVRHFFNRIPQTVSTDSR